MDSSLTKRQIEANKRAWALLAEDHYKHFREQLATGKCHLNSLIQKEIGDLKGKELIHLQCNTGADTLYLAQLGAVVTGVDLVEENIAMAEKLAEEFRIPATFFPADIMQLKDLHTKTYDVVFTSEGALGWLPDLNRWAETIAALLKPGGYVYVMDTHPAYLALDEKKLSRGELVIGYPYFGKTPDESQKIGGYASEAKEATSYFWNYSLGDVVTVLARVGLTLEFLHEYDVLSWQEEGMEEVEPRLYSYPFLRGKFPLSFSIKAAKNSGPSSAT